VTRVNDEADVLRDERPELAIVDRAIWDAVQVRLSEHAQAYRPASLALVG
jgi:hypothetical protein